MKFDIETKQMVHGLKMQLTLLTNASGLPSFAFLSAELGGKRLNDVT